MKVTKFLFLTLSLFAIFSFTSPTSVKSVNQPMMTTVSFLTLSSSDCAVLGLKASWGFPATSILILDETTGEILYNGAGNNSSSKKFGAIAGHVYYVDVYNISTGDNAAGSGSPECF